MRKTMRSAAAAMVVVVAAVWCAPPRASAETGQVRYAMWSDVPWRSSVYYRVAPPPGGNDHDNDVLLGPDDKWEAAVELENPYRWAFVSVDNRYGTEGQRLHCEIWIDGRLATKGAGNCAASNG